MQSVKQNFDFTAKINFEEGGLERFLQRHQVSRPMTVETFELSYEAQALAEVVEIFRRKLEHRLREDADSPVSVIVNGYRKGSLIIFFTIVASYEFISKYKNFVDSVKIIRSQAENVLSDMFYYTNSVDVQRDSANSAMVADRQDSGTNNNIFGGKARNLHNMILVANILIGLAQVSVLSVLIYHQYYGAPASASSQFDPYKYSVGQAQQTADDAKRMAEDIKWLMLYTKIDTVKQQLDDGKRFDDISKSLDAIKSSASRRK